MQSFETLLRGSVQAHGHLCPGQVVGVRMAMLGCRLIGLDDPAGPDQIKKLKHVRPAGTVPPKNGLQ